MQRLWYSSDPPSLRLRASMLCTLPVRANPQHWACPRNWVRPRVRRDSRARGILCCTPDIGGNMGAETAAITRVALVEDDREARERLVESIRQQGSLELVAVYSTDAEALAGLEAGAPDVLLVDLGLPDVSGLEVVRFVSNRYPECDILVISIFGDEANVLAALEAGARGYLLKGSLQHDIAFDIQDLRNGGSPLSPVIARQVLKRLHAPASAIKPDDETVLTPRESEILNAISRGFSYAETAQLLGVSVGTVHTFLKRIYRKLAVHSKTEAVFEANRLGLIR